MKEENIFEYIPLLIGLDFIKRQPVIQLWTRSEDNLVQCNDLHSLTHFSKYSGDESTKHVILHLKLQ